MTTTETKYSAGIGYKTGGRWSGSVSSSGSWLVANDGKVRLQWIDGTIFETRAEVEQHLACAENTHGGDYIPNSLSLSVWSDVPDEVRATITHSGWANIPTKAECEAQWERDFQAFEEKVRKERDLREGGQKLDPLVPVDDAPVPTKTDVLAERDGQTFVPIRIMSDGYGATADDFGGVPVDELLRKRGAEIHYDAPAVVAHGGFIGSVTGGELREICYTLNGNRKYLYVATFSGVDSWNQEWWVAPYRLTGNAAATVIEKAREVLRTARLADSRQP